MKHSANWTAYLSETRPKCGPSHAWTECLITTALATLTGSSLSAILSSAQPLVVWLSISASPG